ncbi:MAG: hypothetical protein MUP82_08255 [Candidatus Marinimicrobia bacterium]|nr:hypothetical protein [Candidatus Neomarinimicrobiota bacterium]
MNKIDLFCKLSYKRTLIISGFLTIIIFLTLGYFDRSLITENAPKGIISFEFAKNMDKSISIISSWDLSAQVNAGLSLGIDFLFLIVYAIFFATACYLVAQKYIYKNNLMYKTGLLIAKLQFVAALFDAIENFVLIKLLLGSNNNIFSLIAYYFASIKFVIIGIGIIYIIIGYTASLFQKGLESE